MLMKNPPHPGEILREDYLIPLELTVTELAKILKVSRQTLSEILNEKSGISPIMALKLSKAFSTTPESWLNKQIQYDLAKARKKINLSKIDTIFPVSA